LEASLAELMVFTFLTALTGIFLASVLRGFTGFGFGLAAVPLLSLVLPPAQVAPFVVLLQVIVGAGGLRAAMHQTDWRSIRGLVPGVLVGIPLGLLILTAFLPNTVRLAIGLIIAASVVLLWRGARLPPRPSGVVTMAVGMLSGVISGLASMGGPPVVVYLIAVGNGAAAVRATSIVYFMLSGLTSAAAMAYRGMIDQEILLWTLAAIPAAYGGNWIGTWAFHKAKPHHHRMTALIVLSMLAAVLIVRSLAAG
jgi:uncharacterized membrane protein YfcA